jgi:hypothetical protein
MNTSIDFKPFLMARMDDSFESFVNYLLSSMIAFMMQKPGVNIQELLAEVFGEDRHKTVPVKLEIGGIEFPFVEAMRTSYTQWNSIVESRARELIQERFESKVDPILLLLDDLRTKLNHTIGSKEDGF